MDGYPAAFTAERMSEVLGRELGYIRLPLGGLAPRWTYENGLRVVVNKERGNGAW